jgi:hypothetical protein
VTHDVLAQLLKSADGSAPTPTLASDLPTRVRRRHRHRRAQTIAVTATTTLLLAIGLTALLPRPGTPGRGQGRGASDATRLAALDREIALHEQTATLLLASPVPKPSVAPAPDDSVLSEIRRQRDRAALILVYEADRAAADKQPDRALAAYRRTIELFPTTYWANIARQRLKEMST